MINSTYDLLSNVGTFESFAEVIENYIGDAKSYTGVIM